MATKNTDKDTATTEKPKRTKRPARSYDERIAELQAMKQARIERTSGSARKTFDALRIKHDRAISRVEKYEVQLASLAEEYGFALDEPLPLADVQFSDEVDD